MNLSSPVSAVPKVGPKYRALLQKLEIDTVEDLLYHFPFRYNDFSKIKKIKDLEPNETATIKAELLSINNIFTRFGKRLTKAVLRDETGDTEAIWFNQHYLKQAARVGEWYFLSGKVGTFSRKLSLVSPEFELTGVDSINTGRLVPIYPETAGVSSKFLRGRINDILSPVGEQRKNGAEIVTFLEFLPPDILSENKYPLFFEALKKFHFPGSPADAEIAKERFAFEELFLELINVESRKHAWRDQFFATVMDKKHRASVEKLMEGLPFTLTDSQQGAVSEILEDMEKEHPMNKLLEGDVGTGKTIVAVIAGYYAILNGLNVLYMAPTEILARQHYETFKDFLGAPDVEIRLLTGASKGKPKKDLCITIGTHALLFAKEQPQNVGLIVIDEQHRFGVEQRTKILEAGDSRKKPHFLSMTATPIPRTLALTLYGDLSISALKTPPNVGKKITTKVVPERGRQKTYQWIKDRVTKHNDKAFIVCPLIEESSSQMLENVKAAEKEFKELKEGVFSDVETALLHGRVKPAEKQKILEEFRNGKTKVLVSTPVIEVGVDIPEATIMVIESGERYGLASLHQLRGRVGRGDKEGFCLVMASNISRNSYTRLKHLENTANGLELAEIDLKMRGQGDIYGTMQSGFAKFKVADLSDMILLAKVKEAAQKYFQRLNEFPLLRAKVESRKGTYVGNN